MQLLQLEWFPKLTFQMSIVCLTAFFWRLRRRRRRWLSLFALVCVSAPRSRATRLESRLLSILNPIPIPQSLSNFGFFLLQIAA